MPASAQSYQQLSQFDEQVLALASSFNLVVTRTKESFVSYDGAGVLNVSPPSELDADDSLAQIVLHELAHYWVEGVDSYGFRDWGLSNLDTGHLDREYAALRLQLEILAPHNLQRLLHPTTVHRWFYRALLRIETAAAEVPPEVITELAPAEDPETPCIDQLQFAARRSLAPFFSGTSNFAEDHRRELVTNLLQDIANSCLPCCD